MLDLFSGIGGMSLAADWAGIETVAFCEIEPYCQKVLKKHWPTVPVYTDVRELTREKLEKDGVIDNERTIDIVAGGYPCQPFSVAGKRRGQKDDRNLWPEMFRLVRELRPTWVVGENVAGHVSLGLDDALSDLESEGYKTRAFVIPACAVGAPHRRDRVFIVAYADGNGRFGRSCDREGRYIQNHEQRYIQKDQSKGDRRFDWTGEDCQIVADTGGTGCEECNIAAITSEQRHDSRGSDSFGANWSTQPGLGGMLDGLSDWLDGCRWPAPLGQLQYEWEPPRVINGAKNRVPRLKALGNAVVPQQVYPIFKAIAEIETS